MELKNELEKLASYFATTNEGDVQRFKEQFALIRKNFTTEVDKKNIEDFFESMVAKSRQQSEKDMEYIRFRASLLENKDIIPMSFIAQHYFKKSKSWIYQRINENRVNGKSAKFSAEEINIFNFALKDISKKIGSISMPA
ncbi:hypothetical protein AGMMS50239_03860 [Bacteroidia bacterium]|nr:hypothetical protein AGMMS50239_03860 [Bacteroidia bacterium]